MTIKGLNNLIKDKYKQVIEECWLSDFKDYRIFIDADNIVYHYIASASKKVLQSTDIILEEIDRNKVMNEFMKSMITLCLDFLRLDIVPVLVFDGKPPEAKSKTRQKRITKKEELRSKINSTKESIQSQDVLNVSKTEIENHKKLLLQDNYITREEMAYFKIILNSLEIPIVEANCESEKVCSSFCIEGKGTAVYSQDSDCLAHGNFLTIRKLYSREFREDKQIYDRKVEYIILDKLLDHIELEYSSFVDLCIASGTDYNDNVKQMGITRMMSLIKTHGSIDNLPRDKDWSILKHKEIRHIFDYQESSSLCLSIRLDLPKSIPVGLRSILESINALDLYPDLVEMINKFKDKEIKERGYKIDPKRKRCKFIVIEQ